MSAPGRAGAILSPHLDDAVLSCWHLLSSPGEVAVLNICTAAPPTGAPAAFWDLLNDGHDPAERMRKRRGEDEAALRLAGRRAHHLGLLDFQYTAAAPAVGAIVQGVLGILEPGTLLYVPLGLGVHPDHLAARAAGLELERLGFAVAFYAELPHAVRPGWLERLTKAPAYAGLTGGGLIASKHRLDDRALAAKLRAVGEYRTQLAGLEGMLGGPVDRGDVLRHEVVWAGRSSADLAERGGTERLALRLGE